MARINVEDTIYRDGRFLDLCIKVGNKFLALGICMAAWELAQRWYLKSPSRCVPVAEWKKAGIPDAFLEVGLARLEEGGIRVSGSESQFNWLITCSNSGQKGGFAKSQGNSSRVPLGYPKGSLASYSSLSSLSQEEEEEKDKRAKTKTKPEASSAAALPPLAKIWNDHCGQLPKVIGCNATRKRLAEARWRDRPETEHWAEVVRRILASPFCNGKNDRGWRASFDWLLQPDVQNKVLEGKYDATTNGVQIDWKKVFGETG